MAPIERSMAFNKQTFPFLSNNTTRGFGYSANDDGLFENESVSERGWDMGEESEMIDEDMNDTALMVREDDSIVDEVAMSGTGVSGMGPEFETFAQFLDSLGQKMEKSHDDKSLADKSIFETILIFKDIAESRVQDYIARLKELQASEDIRVNDDGVEEARDTSGEYVSFREIQSHIDYWETEVQTWDLFFQLYKHRLNRVERPDPDHPPPELDRNASNIKFREYLLESDPQFKELNIILNWVTKHAPRPDEIDNTKGAGWAYTKTSLKARKRQKYSTTKSQKPKNSFFATSATMNNVESDPELVTELDPDAPSRQGKYLEEEDVAFEQRLMKAVFQHLRAGDIAGAMEKCKQVRELWRAQSLIGGFDAWDAEIDGTREGIHGLEGNRQRELWRRMCYRLAKEISGWESAVYGILSGDLESVLPKCITWEDHLFAHLNSLVESIYCNYLSAHQRIPTAVQKFPIYDAVQHHGGPDAKYLPRIIDALQEINQIDLETRVPQRVLQGVLMSERLDAITAELSRQLEQARTDPDWEPENDNLNFAGLHIGQFRPFRVIVHIILTLKALGAGPAPGSQEWKNAEEVVAGYIDLLADSGKHELVPLYAGQLSREKAIQVMGHILVKVTNEDARHRLLSLMRGYNIDVPETLKQMMEMVFEKSAERYRKIPLPRSTGILSPHSSGINNSSAVEEEDEQLIRALEWLLLVKELKYEVMRAGCLCYQRFFLTGRLAAAKELYKRIPSTTIVPENGHHESMDMDEPKSDSVQTDPFQASLYIEFENFVRALSTLEEWKEVIRRTPENKRDRTYKIELERAYDKIQSVTRPIAVNWLIYFIPSYPMPGTTYDAPKLQVVRDIYIPDLILALHRVYTEAGIYLRRNLLTQALELAALVGSNTRDGHEIVRCFVNKGRMREYVDAIAEASRIILGAAQVPGREVTRRGVAGNGAGNLQIWNVK